MTPSSLFIVGKRASGKTTTLCELLGEGHSTVVFTLHPWDVQRYAAAAPAAQVTVLDGVMTPRDLSGCLVAPRVRCLALDDVVCGSRDPLLADALRPLAEGRVGRLLVASDHPSSVPLDMDPVTTAVLLLSDTYSGTIARDCISGIKSMYPFQLRAKAPGIEATGYQSRE